MIRNAVVGAIALALFSPVLASATIPDPVPVEAAPIFGDYPLVRKVQCNEGSGTAFRVGRTKFLSVDHVTSLTNCRIDGVPIWTQPNRKLDFSESYVPIPREGAFKISCEGFIKGQHYWAIGHALGKRQRVIELYSYGFQADNGMAVLIGWPTVIPGMSGGPVLNERGEVVGTVNMFSPYRPVSLSRALKDTPLCQF